MGSGESTIALFIEPTSYNYNEIITSYIRLRKALKKFVYSMTLRSNSRDVDQHLSLHSRANFEETYFLSFYYVIHFLKALG